MANKKNKLKKPNVKMTKPEKEAIEEFAEAKTSWKTRLKEVSKKPAMVVILDIIKILGILLVIELFVVAIPTSINVMGELIGVGTSDATSTSNYMVLWQGYNTFIILCEFHIMLRLIKPIWNSISLVKKRKAKKQEKEV
jgi:hypothetical protein